MNGIAKLLLEVSYSQVAVFWSSLQQPFNDWTDRHVAQGFAWRPGCASFRTLVEAGTCEVTIEMTDHADPIGSDVVRAIEVPFEVPPNGAVEIASISASKGLSIAPGTYTLRCEFRKPTSDVQPIRLTFVKGGARHFEILRADPKLSVAAELLTTAGPA
jgi:hypothetical protein